MTLAILTLPVVLRSVTNHAAHQQASKQTVLAFLVLSTAVGFLASGCHSSATAERATSIALGDRVEIDAGVIFAGESNYLCIPFKRLGLASSAQITSIETSCECVAGSVVSFQTPTKTVARAVRLDFAPEPLSANSDFVPMLLSVQVALEIADVRSKREFSVNLTHAVQFAEEVLSKVVFRK